VAICEEETVNLQNQIEGRKIEESGLQLRFDEEQVQAEKVESKLKTEVDYLQATVDEREVGN